MTGQQLLFVLQCDAIDIMPGILLRCCGLGCVQGNTTKSGGLIANYNSVAIFTENLLLPRGLSRFQRTALALLWLASVGCCAAQPTPSQRAAFLGAERAVAENKLADYQRLSAELSDYPLLPYLRYLWAKSHLEDDQSVIRFLDAHANTRYAPPLRNKWLIQLGERQRWSELLSYYRGSEDPELQCYAGLAYLQSGRSDEAFAIARPLWLSGNEPPGSCASLFSTYQASPYFNRDLLWQRFKAALKRGNSEQARRLLPAFTDAELRLANLWLDLQRQPEGLAGSEVWREYPAETRAEGLVFATELWLEQDLNAALTFWDRESAGLPIPADSRKRVEKQIGLALATQRDRRAFPRLAALDDSDASVREWRVRAALQQQSWPEVALALSRLNSEERNQDKWQYWMARSQEQTGQREPALNIYRQIADQRSYYGFLAAGKLGQTVKLVDKPLVVPESELDDLQSRPEFLEVSEFLALDRPLEAKRQWGFAIAKLDKPRLAAAAKLAQRWGWSAQAIATVAKANEWDDIGLRFPIAYADSVRQAAGARQLEPALIFGLIRQESAFDPQADSPAGAKGLMQVMPNTGQEIAKNLREPWNGASDLLKPDTNIRFGAWHFKRLLERFDRHPALAAAAYNAGANRVRRWLPSEKALPADIWVETIPYKETRGYVASVLMYSLIYRERLNAETPRADDLTRDVMPG